MMSGKDALLTQNALRYHNDPLYLLTAKSKSRKLKVKTPIEDAQMS